MFPLSLGTVHATDLDGDPVIYSLLHNFSIFTVSPAGGEVAALEELTQTYTLTVVAADGGTPPKTGSALIQVSSEGMYIYIAVHVSLVLCTEWPLSTACTPVSRRT